jgi:1,4-dihydroxy-2-naphthoyl-CoA synthase
MENDFNNLTLEFTEDGAIAIITMNRPKAQEYWTPLTVRLPYTI